MGNLCECGRLSLDRYEGDCSSNWDDQFPAITRAELKAKRRQFWETRTSGTKQIWMGLHTAVECHRDGDADSCQAIIEAMGCTALTLGKNKRFYFVYDERGTKYVMPVYLFQEPKNLLEYQGLNQQLTIEEQKESQSAPSNEPIQFTVRCNIGRDLDCIMDPQKSIEELKQYISTNLNNLDPTKIRIIFKGRMLSNEYCIAAPIAIKNGDIVHASFPSALYQELHQESTQPPNEDL